MKEPTMSQWIRKVALGPTPKYPDTVAGWLGYFTTAWVVVTARTHGPRVEVPDPWWCANDTERRMFLLFVAEALE